MARKRRDAPKRKGRSGGVWQNTEREYRREVRSGEMAADDRAAMRAHLERMQALEYFRGRR